MKVEKEPSTRYTKTNKIYILIIKHMPNTTKYSCNIVHMLCYNGPHTVFGKHATQNSKTSTDKYHGTQALNDDKEKEIHGITKLKVNLYNSTGMWMVQYHYISSRNN
jgi:hypothetical protein